MTLGKKRVYLAGLALQLFLIIAVSSRDTFWVLSKSRTVFPESSKNFWQQSEQIASTALGQRLPRSNPVRQIFAGYLHLSGIEVGKSHPLHKIHWICGCRIPSRLGTYCGGHL